MSFLELWTSVADVSSNMLRGIESEPARNAYTGAARVAIFAFYTEALMVKRCVQVPVSWTNQRVISNCDIQSARKFSRFVFGSCPCMTALPSFQSHAGRLKLSDSGEGSIRAHQDTSISALVQEPALSAWLELALPVALLASTNPSLGTKHVHSNHSLQ